MYPRRAFALVTGLVGVLVFAATGIAVAVLGFPLLHWLMALHLATATTAIAAAFLLWTNNRAKMPTAVVAWILIGVMAAPIISAFVVKLLA
jgi:hypothetical protein